MRFICSGWGRARSATGWFYLASLGHRIHRTAFAKELKGHRERDAPLFRCNVNREGEEVPIIAKIPRAVALSRAAAAGVSVADYDPKSHVVAPIELLADSVLNEEGKNNG